MNFLIALKNVSDGCFINKIGASIYQESRQSRQKRVRDKENKQWWDSYKDKFK